MATNAPHRSGRRRRWRMGTSGTAGLELALAAPILALMVTAGYDFGQALYEEHRLIAAARAGAQYGIQSSKTWTDSTDIIAAARADAGDTSDSLTITTTICTCPSGASQCNSSAACTGSTISGTYVEVTVSESYTTVVNYPFINSPFTITGQAFFRVE